MIQNILSIIFVAIIIISLFYWVYKGFGQQKSIFGGSRFSLDYEDIKGSEQYDPKYRFNNKHDGQRKLFLSEVDFLDNNAKNGDVVVYIGAAPGKLTGKLWHIPELVKMYPKLHFELYDPRPMNITAKNVTVFQQLVTEKVGKEIAKRNKNKRVLFISDIRTLIFKDSKEQEKNINDNNQLQLTVARFINPTISMFKFRIPFNLKSIKYPVGKIRLQVWPREGSTETRLWVKDLNKMATYTLNEYESKMFYHNKRIRRQGFDAAMDRQIMSNHTSKK